MHPLRISLFIVVVLSLLFGLMFLSQPYLNEKGKEEDGFAVGSFLIKYPTISNFLEDQRLSKEQIDSLNQIIKNIESFVEVEQVKEEIEIPDYTKIDSTRIQRIVYPGEREEFIEKLLAQLNDTDCRIVHYGDSQIEGDRITAYLRNRLQSMYGGNGPGFIPIKQVYHQLSAEVIPSENWLRYAAFDPTQKKLENRGYGAYLSVSRFTPVRETPKDSLEIPEPEIIENTVATIDIRPSRRMYAKLGSYNNIVLHYGNCLDEVSIKVFHDGNLLKDDFLIPDGKYHAFRLSFPETPSHIQIVLEGKESPDFYGLTLDGNSGVKMDNVAMRGSSGTVFSQQNHEIFSGMYRELKPKVIFFQYGGNTVPYLKDSLAVDNYSRYVQNHINWVRKNSPDASIFFVGPSDMATLVNGKITSYDLLPYLDKKLKEKCLENNVAYWSMFKAMGGKNSLQYWYEQNLMGSDYTHFTPSGTRVIAELLFTSLQLDLKKQK